MQPEISLQPLNSSYVVLIPKLAGSTEPKDFCPINLIHGVQRIFSKILASRMQTVVDQLVDHNQTGFIRGRQITESFLYAQRVIYKVVGMYIGIRIGCW
jgi:hypothetical protein